MAAFLEKPFVPDALAMKVIEACRVDDLGRKTLEREFHSANGRGITELHLKSVGVRTIFQSRRCATRPHYFQPPLMTPLALLRFLAECLSPLL